MSIIDTVTGQDEKTNSIHAVAPTPQRLKKNARVAIITGDGTEDLEFFYPYYRLTEEGYDVDVITEKGGKFAGTHGIGLNETMAIGAARPSDYALLYLPGGKAPAELRKNDAVIDFVRQFAESGKPIAAVCHGPQLLVTADLVRGKQLAAYPGIREEIEQAGGTFVDEALVEDGQFVTARLPGDLHRHLYGVLQYLKGADKNESRDVRRAAGAR